MNRHWATPFTTFAGLVLTAFVGVSLLVPPTVSATPTFRAISTVRAIATPATARSVGSARATAATFPISVTTGGTTVRIDKKPVRILCLSASATQMLYAIGAGTQVVAVDKYSTYPPTAPRTKLTGYETSAEDYLRYKPDLVIVAFDEGTMVKQLAEVHIPALVLPPASGFPAVYSQLRLLGEATGHTTGAAKVTASLKKGLSSVVRSAAGKGVGKTYYLEISPKPLYTATSATFIGAEFSLFGMRNIANKAAHGNAYPEISGEYLLASNPDWVFLADTVCCHATAKSFAARPGFSVLRAVKDHQVIGVNDSVASQWGPHTITELTSLLARELRS